MDYSKESEILREEPGNQLTAMRQEESFWMPLDRQKRQTLMLQSLHGAVRRPLQRAQAAAEAANGLMMRTVDNTAFSA